MQGSPKFSQSDTNSWSKFTQKDKFIGWFFSFWNPSKPRLENGTHTRQRWRILGFTQLLKSALVLKRIPDGQGSNRWELKRSALSVLAVVGRIWWRRWCVCTVSWRTPISSTSWCSVLVFIRATFPWLLDRAACRQCVLQHTHSLSVLIEEMFDNMSYDGFLFSVKKTGLMTTPDF